jgi:hypothetical protein
LAVFFQEYLNTIIPAIKTVMLPKTRKMKFTSEKGTVPKLVRNARVKYKKGLSIKNDLTLEGQIDS